MKTGTDRQAVLFTPLTEKRAFKEIEKQIRELIYSKALRPGDKLPSEKELAVQFNTGRLSVREALRMLEQAGFITVKQGSTGGSYVRELDHAVTIESMIDLLRQGDIGVRDVTQARYEVEKVILKTAFSTLTKYSLYDLETSVKELEAIVADGEREKFPVYPLLTDFHMLLARFTNNPVYPIILKALIEVVVRVMTPATVGLERLKKHASAHRQIFEGLRNGNLADASQALEKHLSEVELRGDDQNRLTTKAGSHKSGARNTKGQERR